MMERAELKHFRADAITWRDRVGAATAATNEEAARFPYLGDAFQLQSRNANALPAPGNVHIFNWGATMSHGQLAGDIPGLTIGVARLTQGIVRDLFVAENAHFLDKLHAHAEYELKPTRYYVPPA
jgi:FAD-dependent urate hydroxylase